MGNGIKKIISNKIVFFVFSRYLTYGIQFVNSLLFAIFLGPFYLGVWGFFNLIVQYFLQIDFGVANSFQALASIHKNEGDYTANLFNTSLSLVAIIGVIVTCLFSFNFIFDWEIGQKYQFGSIALLACFSVITNYFINLFSGLFRVYGKVIEIAFSQSSFPICGLVTILFFRGYNLVFDLCLAYLTSNILALLVFIIRCPIKFKINLNLKLVKQIQIKGFYLFLYNASFYLIIISTRSFISGNYGVSDFGHFTFAYSLANVVLLLLQSFSYLIYPKLLNRLAHADNYNSSRIIEKVKSEYVLISHLLVHFVIVIFPFFLFLFPQYKDSLKVFNFCTLSIVLYTNCFGFQGYLIAKGEEKRIALIALFALALNICIAYLLTNYFRVQYYYVIIATAVSYIFFIFLVTIEGRKILKLDLTLKSVFMATFPLNLLIPYLISFTIILLNLNTLAYFIPLIIFIILNFQRIFDLKKSIVEIINNKNIINI